MHEPGRKWTASDYRFTGVNGQEKANEIFANASSAEYWMYDARVLRRWERDPVVDPSLSPYAVFANNPIFFSDPLGLEPGDGDKEKKPVKDGKASGTIGSDNIKQQEQVTADYLEPKISYELIAQTPEEKLQELDNLNVIGGITDVIGEVIVGAASFAEELRQGSNNWFDNVWNGVSDFFRDACSRDMESFDEERWNSTINSFNDHFSDYNPRKFGGDVARTYLALSPLQSSNPITLYRIMDDVELALFKSNNYKFTPNPNGNSLYLWSDEAGKNWWLGNEKWSGKNTVIMKVNSKYIDSKIYTTFKDVGEYDAHNISPENLEKFNSMVEEVIIDEK